MKKIKYSVLMLSIFSFSILSCKKEQTTNEVTAINSKSLALAQEDLGEKHNVGCAYLYNELVTLKNSEVQFGLADIPLYLKTWTLDFLTQEGFNTEDLDEEIIDDLMDGFMNQISDATVGNAEVDLTSIPMSSELMAAYNSLANELDNATSPASFETAATSLLAITTLTDDDEERAFIGAVDVAINSYYYWDDNISDWFELFEVPNPPTGTALVVNKKAAVYNDAKGALIGGLSGALEGAVFGGGIPGAVAGFLVVGGYTALTGSIGSIFDDWAMGWF